MDEYIEYITEENDTFDLIAYKQYGEEFLADRIIKANLRYADTVLFEGGVVLKIPVLTENEVDESLPPWRTENESEL